MDVVNFIISSLTRLASFLSFFKVSNSQVTINYNMGNISNISTFRYSVNTTAEENEKLIAQDTTLIMKAMEFHYPEENELTKNEHENAHAEEVLQEWIERMEKRFNRPPVYT
ncbi:4915_t:CDS:2 [Funneliformis mosseae]|uniref:4915_t:CDS:1 n=1 Tax=Funneliformis mosseae TaxID=27381 RepID=A0A9N8VJI7_FUNMO|nr:4915_t:CDS:2 [Funneliformis mosseae]